MWYFSHQIHIRTYRHEYLVHIAGGFCRRFHEKQAVVVRVRLSFLQPTASLTLSSAVTHQIIQGGAKKPGHCGSKKVANILQDIFKVLWKSLTLFLLSHSE